MAERLVPFVAAAGWMYFLIGPVQWLYWSRLRQRRTR